MPGHGATGNNLAANGRVSGPRGLREGRGLSQESVSILNFEASPTGPIFFMIGSGFERGKRNCRLKGERYRKTCFICVLRTVFESESAKGFFFLFLFPLQLDDAGTNWSRDEPLPHFVLRF